MGSGWRRSVDVGAGGGWVRAVLLGLLTVVVVMEEELLSCASSSSNVHASLLGVSESSSAASPAAWKRLRLRTRRREKSHF